MLSKPGSGQQSGERSASPIPPESGNDVELLGYWSARLMMLLSFGLAASMLLGLFGISTHALCVVITLLLGPCLVVMAVALHVQASEEKRIWSELGLISAVVYALLISGVHYAQLTWTPGTSWSNIGPIVQDTGTALFRINMLAYGLLSLSTGFAARVIAVGDGVSAWVRRLLMLNAWLVLPAMMIPVIWPATVATSAWAESSAGMVALLLWSVLFIPVTDLIRARFQRLRVHRECRVIPIR